MMLVSSPITLSVTAQVNELAQGRQCDQQCIIALGNAVSKSKRVF